MPKLVQFVNQAMFWLNYVFFLSSAFPTSDCDKIIDGQCHEPFSQGPCQDEEWLIATDSGILECVKNPYKKLTPSFTVSKSCLGNSCCKNGRVWSKIRRRCVRAFFQ